MRAWDWYEEVGVSYSLCGIVLITPDGGLSLATINHGMKFSHDCAKDAHHHARYA